MFLFLYKIDEKSALNFILSWFISRSHGTMLVLCPWLWSTICPVAIFVAVDAIYFESNSSNLQRIAIWRKALCRPHLFNSWVNLPPFLMRPKRFPGNEKRLKKNIVISFYIKLTSYLRRWTKVWTKVNFSIKNAYSYYMNHMIIESI